MQMQKGLCVEQKNDHAIFILPNGQFVEGKPAAEIMIGEEGYFYPLLANIKAKRKVAWAPVLAAFAALAILFSILMPSQEAYAYVQIQVNPGIEIGVGENGEAISVRGLNKDGRELAEKLGKWNKQPLESVLNKVMTLTVKNTTKEITITTVKGEEVDFPLEQMVTLASSKAVKDNVKIRLKKATKAQWRQSVKSDVPVSQLVSGSTLLKNESSIVSIAKNMKKAKQAVTDEKTEKDAIKEQKKQRKILEKKAKEKEKEKIMDTKKKEKEKLKVKKKEKEKEKEKEKVKVKENEKVKEKIIENRAGSLKPAKKEKPKQEEQAVQNKKKTVPKAKEKEKTKLKTVKEKKKPLKTKKKKKNALKKKKAKPAEKGKKHSTKQPKAKKPHGKQE